jgi:hypothetical protein
VDTHSYTVGADYRIYAATMTGFRGGCADTLENVIASDGTTVLEADDGGGAIGSPSNIAGSVLPTVGTYYVRVRQFNTASLPGPICPYDFYVRVLSGSPIPETEPNEGCSGSAALQRLGGRVIGPATAKHEGFAITVNGKDTIGVIVGVDLERGAPVWNVIAGNGVFTGSFIITL